MTKPINCSKSSSATSTALPFLPLRARRRLSSFRAFTGMKMGGEGEGGGGEGGAALVRGSFSPLNFSLYFWRALLVFLLCFFSLSAFSFFLFASLVVLSLSRSPFAFRFFFVLSRFLPVFFSAGLASCSSAVVFFFVLLPSLSPLWSRFSSVLLSPASSRSLFRLQGLLIVPSPAASQWSIPNRKPGAGERWSTHTQRPARD